MLAKSTKPPPYGSQVVETDCRGFKSSYSKCKVGPSRISTSRTDAQRSVRCVDKDRHRQLRGSPSNLPSSDLRSQYETNRHAKAHAQVGLSVPVRTADEQPSENWSKRHQPAPTKTTFCVQLKTFHVFDSPEIGLSVNRGQHCSVRPVVVMLPCHGAEVSRKELGLDIRSGPKLWTVQVASVCPGICMTLSSTNLRLAYPALMRDLIHS
jgi:hypothetical protein